MVRRRLKLGPKVKRKLRFKFKLDFMLRLRLRLRLGLRLGLKFVFDTSSYSTTVPNEVLPLDRSTSTYGHKKVKFVISALSVRLWVWVWG